MKCSNENNNRLFKNFIYFGIILTFMLSFYSGFSFQRFSNYVTKLKIDNNEITINKEIEIENYGQVGIVPGEMIFRILNVKESDIINISAKDEFGNTFPVKINPSDDFVEVVVENYIPIFAQSKQKVFIDYTIKSNLKGLLFYSFEYPLMDTSIPIQNGKIIIIPGKNLYLTYAPEAKCEKNECFFEIKNQKNKMVEFELSRIPLPKLKVKAYYVFWYGIIAMLLLISILQLIIRKVLK
ncbi:MAG: hypothetical protein QXR30_00175 [Candidatus Woesearchaeota archaeon]